MAETLESTSMMLKLRQNVQSREKSIFVRPQSSIVLVRTDMSLAQILGPNLSCSTKKEFVVKLVFLISSTSRFLQVENVNRIGFPL